MENRQRNSKQTKRGNNNDAYGEVVVFWLQGLSSGLQNIVTHFFHPRSTRHRKIALIFESIIYLIGVALERHSFSALKNNFPSVEAQKRIFLKNLNNWQARSVGGRAVGRASWLGPLVGCVSVSVETESFLYIFH